MATLNFSPATFDFTLYRGDTLPLDIYLKAADGSTYSLNSLYATGTWVPTMNIETQYGVSVYQGAITSTAQTDGTKIEIVSTNPTNTQLKLFIGATTSQYLLPGVSYYYDLQVTNSTGKITQTLLKGIITVEGDITQ